MKILSCFNIPYYSSNYNTSCKPSFSGDVKVTLDYVIKKRAYILPERMVRAVKKEILDSKKNTKKAMPSLFDLHKKIYAPLLDCKTLEQAQSLFPEFREVLNADKLIKKNTYNIRKIKEKVSLSDFSLYVLKERWANLKTLDTIAKEFCLENRNKLGWILEKVRIPDLGKQYLQLLKSSDVTLRKEIADKVTAFNNNHRAYVINRNRELSKAHRELNRKIFQTAWDRLPHIKEAFSMHSHNTSSKERFRTFWQKYPNYLKELQEMRKQVAEELRVARKSLSNN